MSADPRLTDYDLLLDNIEALREGKPADVPIYDFKQSKRVGFNRVEVPTSRVVIIEGIYALSSRIRRVFMTACQSGRKSAASCAHSRSACFLAMSRVGTEPSHASLA